MPNSLKLAWSLEFSYSTRYSIESFEQILESEFKMLEELPLKATPWIKVMGQSFAPVSYTHLDVYKRQKQYIIVV